jgi:hypothetical protein
MAWRCAVGDAYSLACIVGVTSAPALAIAERLCLSRPPFRTAFLGKSMFSKTKVPTTAMIRAMITGVALLPGCIDPSRQRYGGIVSRRSPIGLLNTAQRSGRYHCRHVRRHRPEIGGFREGKNEKQTEGHKVKIHPSGEWPKNITVRIPLGVKILTAFRPQCPGSIRFPN